ncbi:AbrB/MazE/SpoVT family DNA-binding domain-containing protein [Vibrio parahaemolyticus]
MKTKIRKIGNSLGLTLPSELVKSCLLDIGVQVELSVTNGKIIIEKSLPEVPVIPSKPVANMTYEELTQELTSGYELCAQIVQSGKHELIPDSVNRSNAVLEEFNRRMFVKNSR